MELVIGAKNVQARRDAGATILVLYRPSIRYEQAESYVRYGDELLECRYGADAYQHAQAAAERWLPYGEELPCNRVWALFK